MICTSQTSSRSRSAGSLHILQCRRNNASSFLLGRCFDSVVHRCLLARQDMYCGLSSSLPVVSLGLSGAVRSLLVVHFV